MQNQQSVNNDEEVVGIPKSVEASETLEVFG